MSEIKEKALTKLEKLINDGENILKTKEYYDHNAGDSGVCFISFTASGYSVDSKLFNQWKQDINLFLSSNKSFTISYNEFLKKMTHYTSFECTEWYISILKSLKENISDDTIKLDFNIEEKVIIKNKKQNSNKIFIVHGRDDVAKLSVESFITTLGLEPIILHKQANEGKTIIEKIEAHSDVGFAIVLLTPDDEGRLKGEEKLENRARQNVIFELGYFMGKLERKYVCGLCKEGFELPSDYHGITYIAKDKHCGWHNKLAKELKAAGIEFDEKKLLEV